MDSLRPRPVLRDMQTPHASGRDDVRSRRTTQQQVPARRSAQTALAAIGFWRHKVRPGPAGRPETVGDQSGASGRRTETFAEAPCCLRAGPAVSHDLRTARPAWAVVVASAGAVARRTGGAMLRRRPHTKSAGRAPERAERSRRHRRHSLQAPSGDIGPQPGPGWLASTGAGRLDHGAWSTAGCRQKRSPTGAVPPAARRHHGFRVCLSGGRPDGAWPAC